MGGHGRSSSSASILALSSTKQCGLTGVCSHFGASPPKTIWELESGIAVSHFFTTMAREDRGLPGFPVEACPDARREPRRSRSPRHRFTLGEGLAGGRRACPESEWLWLGDAEGTGTEGYAVRFGRDRKLSCDGIYSVTRSGPFKVYVFMREVPPAGPSDEDQRLLEAQPACYEICYDTRYIRAGEIFIYGDEVDSQRGGEPGLLMIAGRNFLR